MQKGWSRLKKSRKGLLILGAASAAVLLLWGVRFGMRRLYAKPEYIFLMSGIRGSEDFKMFHAFEETIEELGGQAVILDFEDKENASVLQRQMLKEAVTADTVCIVVNSVSSMSLADLLNTYAARGIRILSAISETDYSVRKLHVGTVDPAAAGEDIFREAANACGGAGKFAIVSESARLVSLTDLIQSIRYSYEKREYPEMIFSNVVYGYEDEEATMEELAGYLKETPDLKVLICLSDWMTLLSCRAVAELGLSDSVTIVGMGKPEYFTDYEGLKLRLFSCDMEPFGEKAARIAHMLTMGEIFGSDGETIRLDGKDYAVSAEIVAGEEEGTRVFLYDSYAWERFD